MKLLILLTIFFSNSVFASEDYKCVITDVVAPVSNGKLKKSELYKNAINQTFVVNRRTGDIAGSIKNNYVTSPVVLDYGSSENSFKAVTIMKNDITTNIYVLTIEEFEESPKKPFVFLSNSNVYSGTCEHFSMYK